MKHQLGLLPPASAPRSAEVGEFGIVASDILNQALGVLTADERLKCSGV